MKMTWNLKFPYKIKFISLVQLCFLVKEVLSLLASCILGSHPYFSWLPNFGNGLLEKLWGWGGGGIYEPQEYFLVIKFHVWIFFRP